MASGCNFEARWPERLEQVLEQATKVLPSLQEDVLDVEPLVEQNSPNERELFRWQWPREKAGEFWSPIIQRAYQIMTAEKSQRNNHRNLANWKASPNNSTGLALVEDVSFSGEIFERTKEALKPQTDQCHVDITDALWVSKDRCALSDWFRTWDPQPSLWGPKAGRLWTLRPTRKYRSDFLLA